MTKAELVKTLPQKIVDKSLQENGNLFKEDV